MLHALSQATGSASGVSTNACLLGRQSDSSCQKSPASQRSFASVGISATSPILSPPIMHRLDSPILFTDLSLQAETYRLQFAREWLSGTSPCNCWSLWHPKLMSKALCCDDLRNRLCSRFQAHAEMAFEVRGQRPTKVVALCGRL